MDDLDLLGLALVGLQADIEAIDGGGHFIETLGGWIAAIGEAPKGGIKGELDEIDRIERLDRRKGCGPD